MKVAFTISKTNVSLASMTEDLYADVQEDTNEPGNAKLSEHREQAIVHNKQLKQREWCRIVNNS
jgi:hypothetical protein